MASLVVSLKNGMNEPEENDSAGPYFRGKRTMTEVPVCGSDVIAISPW